MLMSVYSKSGANPHTLSCLMNLQHGSCTIDIDGMGDPGEIKVEFKAISGITWACGNIRTKCLCASSDTSTCSIPQACSSSRFTFLKASRCSLRRCRAIRSCFCMALWRCSLGSEACAGSGSSSSSNNPCSAGSTLRTRHLDLIASRAAVRGVLPSPTTMHVVLVSERRVIQLLETPRRTPGHAWGAEPCGCLLSSRHRGWIHTRRAHLQCEVVPARR